MPRLLAANIVPVFLHSFEDISVADRRLYKRNAFFFHGQFKAYIAHYGNYQRVLLQNAPSFHIGGTDTEDNIAVNYFACFVASYQPVCIAIERKPYIRAAAFHNFTDFLSVGGPAPVVDIKAVGRIIKFLHFGAESAEQLGRYF